MEKNYPINIKIPGSHFQIQVISVQIFRQNLCTHFLDHAWKNHVHRQTDRQTHGRTDGRTDRHQYTTQTSFVGGII